MPDAICDTGPLLYLHRLGVLDWLRPLFGEIWMPAAVATELREGRQRGYWGTLRVLLAAKSQGLTPNLEPWLDRLEDIGMWISADVRRRVLSLADEQSP